jgi:hypothetical protein
MVPRNLDPPRPEINLAKPISNSGKRARPQAPSAAIPSVWPRVPLTAALLRATPRYLALSPTITTTEDLSPFWLGNFVKQGAAAINQRGDS